MAETEILTSSNQEPYALTDGSGAIVDLADVMLFSEKWRSWTVRELWRECAQEGGEILFYMQYLHPESDWYGQERRIDCLLWELAHNWREHITKDTPENRHWFMKWLFRFKDETENMC